MDNWVRTQVNSGNYENDSEYFCDLLRCDQEKREAEVRLCKLLDDAELSGISDRSPEEIWDATEAIFAENNG